MQRFKEFLLSEGFNIRKSSWNDVKAWLDGNDPVAAQWEFKKEHIKALWDVIDRLTNGNMADSPLVFHDSESKIKIHDDNGLTNMAQIQDELTKLGFKGTRGLGTKFGTGSGEATITAAQWEMIICVAYNKMYGNYGDGNDLARKAAKIDEDSWKDIFDAKVDVAEGIVKGLPSGHIMTHYGSAKDIKLSPRWYQYLRELRGTDAKFAASTKTPKTDMYFSNQIKISLKKVGGSQLMSGKDVDSWGAIKAGIDNAQKQLQDRDYEESLNTIKDNFKDEFSNMKLSDTYKTVTDAQKAIKNNKGRGNSIIEWVIKQTKMQETVMENLNNILGDKSSNTYKAMAQGMVHEAMTGSVKFGNSLASATHLMKFSPAGKLVEWTEIGDASSNVVTEIAENVKIDVKFKSSGSRGTAWSALKMILGETFEEMDGHLLTEEQMLNENFILNWFMKWLDKIWRKIVSVAKQSIAKLAELFNLKMDVKLGSVSI